MPALAKVSCSFALAWPALPGLVCCQLQVGQWRQWRQSVETVLLYMYCTVTVLHCTALYHCARLGWWLLSSSLSFAEKPYVGWKTPPGKSGRRGKKEEEEWSRCDSAPLIQPHHTIGSRRAIIVWPSTTCSRSQKLEASWGNQEPIIIIECWTFTRDQNANAILYYTIPYYTTVPVR